MLHRRSLIVGAVAAAGAAKAAAPWMLRAGTKPKVIIPGWVQDHMTAGAVLPIIASDFAFNRYWTRLLGTCTISDIWMSNPDIGQYDPTLLTAGKGLFSGPSTSSSGNSPVLKPALAAPLLVNGFTAVSSAITSVADTAAYSQTLGVANVPGYNLNLNCVISPAANYGNYLDSYSVASDYHQANMSPNSQKCAYTLRPDLSVSGSSGGGAIQIIGAIDPGAYPPNSLYALVYSASDALTFLQNVFVYPTQADNLLRAMAV